MWKLVVSMELGPEAVKHKPDDKTYQEYYASVHAKSYFKEIELRKAARAAAQARLFGPASGSGGGIKLLPAGRGRR